MTDTATPDNIKLVLEEMNCRREQEYVCTQTHSHISAFVCVRCACVYNV